MKLPSTFASQMQDILQDEFDSFLESYDKMPHNGLRVNTLKIAPQEFEQKFSCPLEPVPWIENGFTYREQGVS